MILNRINEVSSDDNTVEQYAMRAFADALEAIPLALAENSGFSPVMALSELKAEQIRTKNPYLGEKLFHAFSLYFLHTHT